MIKRIRAEGEAKRCLLWSKQQYQSPDPHEVLLRIVLQLIPKEQTYYCSFALEKCSPLINQKGFFNMRVLSSLYFLHQSRNI